MPNLHIQFCLNSPYNSFPNTSIRRTCMYCLLSYTIFLWQRRFFFAESARFPDEMLFSYFIIKVLQVNTHGYIITEFLESDNVLSEKSFKSQMGQGKMASLPVPSASQQLMYSRRCLMIPSAIPNLCNLHPVRV